VDTIVSIFTPTYNRANTINRLFNSLLNQTSLSFEWIIVDDGSKDNTKEVIQCMIESNKLFTIKYIYQENGGKHRAINTGLENASGKYFFIVDSDDYLTNDSIERVLFWFNSIENKSKFAGIGGLKGYSKAQIVGKTFKNGIHLDATSLERRSLGILGDKAEVFITDVFRKYRFPEFPSEKFVSEAIVWNRMASDGLQIRWFNEIIYISEEYRDDGLTSLGMKKFIDNWEGYSFYVKQELELRKGILRRLNLLLIYAKMSKIKGVNINDSIKKLNCNSILFRFSYLFCELYNKLMKTV